MSADVGQRKRVLTRVQIVLAVLVIVGLAWLAWKATGYQQAQQVYHDMEAAYASEPDTIDFTGIQQEYPDVVGWLQMDDMDLSYPIVQGEDNDYYLHYDASGEPSIDGSIFLDYRNKSIDDDLHVLVYGHNMLDESMFGQLDNYVSEQFYRDGKDTFTIYTPKGTYRYKIFAVDIVNPTDEAYQVGFKNAKVFDAYVNSLKNRSMYQTGVDVSGSDHVVTLSTCSANDRLVLSAKRIED